ncbi:MAG: phosphatidylserine decarboxylase, partial [Thermoplasmata archaeon]|nr:phosphatidylserine decarboxylase [Thermoplasmata archaeon]
KGNIAKKGQRIGIIRFGSRVNVWLPADKVKCMVVPGQKVLAGETTIAEVVN